MLIKETSVFTRQVLKLLSGESYRLLQLHLVENPDAGALIRGTGGLRKIRWEGSGRGKRGGVRVIYYWATAKNLLLMLLVYRKKDGGDLSPKQRTILKRMVEEELHG